MTINVLCQPFEEVNSSLFEDYCFIGTNAESNRRGIGLVGSRHHFDACRLTMEPNPSETLAEALLMQKLLTINAHKNYDLQ